MMKCSAWFFCGMTFYDLVVHSDVQCSTVQFITINYSTLQGFTVQSICITSVQYNSDFTQHTSHHTLNNSNLTLH